MFDKIAQPDEDVLFIEEGGRWRTLAFGPIFCAIALAIELFTGPVVHWIGLAAIGIVLIGFTYVQVIAARTHASVVLTTQELRQGTENVALDEIAKVYPPTDYSETEGEPARWELARALGELPSVPRKRHGIGLKLSGGALVQAWAKDDDGLREQLDALMAARRGQSPDLTKDES